MQVHERVATQSKQGGYFLGFLAFLGLAFGVNGAGGLFNIRRSTSSGFGVGRLFMVRG